MSPSLHAARLALLNDHVRLPSAAHVLISMAVTVTRWDRHWRTRRTLNDLEQHILEDIGLSRDAARFEARKPFWKD